MQQKTAIPVLVYQQGGVVLITLLIFSFIMTLVVLATMRTAVLTTTQSQYYLNQQISLQAAEAGLQQAEQALTKGLGKVCRYQQPMLVEAMHNNANWWHKQCLGNFPQAQVNYLIAQYPIKQCQLLQHQGLRVIQIYSIISRAQFLNSSEPVILQIALAKLSHTACLHPSLNPISLGRLSWRQLN